MHERDEHLPTIAIVGAGASGTLTAVQLLRRASHPLRVLLFERAPASARGVAYGTTFDDHLLNVRAGSMSGFPDDPPCCVNWLHARGVASAPTDFVSRRLYGEYLGETLDEAKRAAAEGVKLQVRNDEVVGIGSDSTTIQLRDGEEIHADRVVLALGNFAPRSLLRNQPSDPRVQDDPWASSATAQLDPDAAVLLVGTGLTFVDVVLSLLVQRGHRGPIYAVSRRGLLPQVHADVSPYPRTWTDDELVPTARGLLRAVRTEVREAAARGADWRSVVDSLRPATQRAWLRASPAERERFLRHVQPYWDTHRHRIASQVGAVLAGALESGQLRTMAGRLVSIEPNSEGVHVEVALRRGGQWSAEVARVINCTGPAADLRAAGVWLVSGLLESGLVRQDPLRLGLETAKEGRVVDAHGSPSRTLFAVGPLRKGALWESTAMPEIRVQAAELAELLLREVSAGD